MEGLKDKIEMIYVLYILCAGASLIVINNTAQHL